MDDRFKKQTVKKKEGIDMRNELENNSVVTAKDCASILYEK